LPYFVSIFHFVFSLTCISHVRLKTVFLKSEGTAIGKQLQTQEKTKAPEWGKGDLFRVDVGQEDKLLLEGCCDGLSNLNFLSITS